jgi:hypothetical protein
MECRGEVGNQMLLENEPRGDQGAAEVMVNGVCVGGMKGGAVRCGCREQSYPEGPTGSFAAGCVVGERTGLLQC